MTFEQELVFEGVDDRLDPLPDPADRRVGPFGSSARLGRKSSARSSADGGFELGAGEAFVGDQELSGGWLPFEQLEHCLPLGGVRGDEIEVTNVAVGAAESTILIPQKKRECAGSSRSRHQGASSAAMDRPDDLAAGKRRRVDEAERVVEAGQLERIARQSSISFGPAPAALVVARLVRQIREQMAKPTVRDREKASVARQPSSIWATIRPRARYRSAAAAAPPLRWAGNNAQAAQ